MNSAERQSLPMRDSQTHNRRPSGFNLARFLAERCSTPIWCRRAKFSSSRTARERKIEGRVASSVARKLCIGKENYEKDKPHPLTQIEVFERHNRFNRRRSKSRGKLSLRLAHEAVAVDPVTHYRMVGALLGEPGVVCSRKLLTHPTLLEMDV